MRILDSTLKRLSSGTFVCSVRYPDEYAFLETPEGRQKAEQWLDAVGYRLARLGEDGAFVMCHAVVTNEMRAKFRDELKVIRNRLEPYVSFLETLRQAQSRNPQIHAGDLVWESEISEAVRGSALLERRLSDLKDIKGGQVSDSTNDRVRRMLQQLEHEGYLALTNPINNGYQVTGKVNYLYQLLAFIAEHTPHLSDDGFVDQVDPQARLDAPEFGTKPEAP
jgi:hypothetical protein